ncbi:hypothetical protein G7Y89_g4810 [Cudoniella acicularis]|uniref:Uncharacterized protein n=1 Tax=Cudoniella acicularis TaxID=354080 RepID=A0A8H4RQW2_9HELO|nr:hypothetical protein G7Y89_g4810 [Cudoniella acicularis]
MYKAIRITGPGYNLYYSIWCMNEHELYDLFVDPGQMHNLLSHSSTSSPSVQSPISSSPRIAGHTIQKIVSRLDALLSVQKSCSGATCRAPWKELYPNGDVTTLEDSLDERFDGFYES